MELGYQKRKEIERARSKRVKYIKYNKTLKNIYDIIKTIEAMRPHYQNSLYKEGYDDCLHLLKYGVSKLDL